MKPLIGIIGDYNPEYKTHKMVNQSLVWLQKKYDFDFEWSDTQTIAEKNSEILEKYTGIWSAPGSPFNSLEGALKAIEYARVNNIPHLGTCGGFQHMILEFSRNVLKIRDAQHEEYEAESSNLFITRLSCSLSGLTMNVTIKENSMAFKCYQSLMTIEDYYCNFGINPEFKEKLIHPELVVSGTDQEGEIRIIECPKNRFFVGTLFVPPSRATEEKPHPLMEGFIEAAVSHNLM